MPVNLVGGSDLYSSAEDADYVSKRRQQERFDRQMNNLSKLAQSYQNYRDNVKDREIMKQMTQRQPMGGPNLEILQDPGGGINVLSEEERMRMNRANGINLQERGVGAQRPGFFSGIGASMENSRPLSSLEKLQAEQRIKNQYDPDYQMKLAKLERMRNGSVGPAYGSNPSDWQISELDEYGQPKGYKNYRDEGLRKQIEKYYEPLSGESAGRFAMAEQGEGNVDSIMAQLGMDEQGNVADKGAMHRNLLRAKFSENKPWNAATGPAAAVTTLAGNFIAGKEGQKLSLNYSNLVQNLLRLRTGAAAPIQEQIDEFVRTGYKLGDNPETTYEKLRQGKLLLQSVKNSIKPIPRFKNAAEAERFGFDLGTAAKQFDSVEQADTSGLPKGTVVKVNGRPYQI